MSGSSHAATCPRNPWRHWQARKRNSPALRSQDRDRLRRPRHPSQEKKTKRRSPPSPPEGPTISPTITSYTTTSDLTYVTAVSRRGQIHVCIYDNDLRSVPSLDPTHAHDLVAQGREAARALWKDGLNAKIDDPLTADF